MGTTFTNLQIKISDHTILEEHLPSEFYYLQTALEWYTVLEKDGEHDFKRMQKLGRSLSKLADNPILLVYYFDDDIFELALLSKGKKLCSYHAHMFRNLCKKSSAFIEALCLSTKEAQAFRYLIRQELSAPESIHWLSRLLGARLYSDKDLLDDNEALWCKDTAAVLSEIAAEKKAAKINNQTNLILRDEILGMDIQDTYNQKDALEDTRNRVIRISLADDNGNYDFSRITCFQELNGHFVKVHEYQYPKEIFTKYDMFLCLDYEHQQCSIYDFEAYGYTPHPSWNQWEPIIAQERKIPLDQKPNSCHLPEWLSLPYNHIIVGGYDYRYTYGPLEKIDIENSGLKYNERKIVAEYHYEEESDLWHPSFCVVNDLLVIKRIRSKFRSPDKLIDVRFFDFNLNLLRQEQIAVEGKLPDSSYFCYDQELDTIFFGKMAINLKTYDIVTCSLKIKEGDVLTCLDERKNVYMLSGHSLYVLSAEMKLLSHHLIKGRLLYYYKNANGNMCLITGCDFIERYHQLKTDSGIRIYEIVDRK